MRLLAQRLAKVASLASIVSVATLGAAGLGACAALAPWGEGGPEPTRAMNGAMVMTFDAPALERASTRLGEQLYARWPEGAVMPGAASSSPALVAVDWRGWRIRPVAATIAFGPPPVQALGPGGAELEVRVTLAADSHEIALTLSGPDGLDAACPVTVSLAEGELAIPAALTADKLGRIQGVVLPGAVLRGASAIPANQPMQSAASFKLDLSRCAVVAEPGALLAAVESAFAGSAVAALTDGLVGALPAAMRLELAFAWSGTVTNDALGAGFLRASLRGVLPELVRTAPGRLEVALALGVEADAHPCIGHATLPVLEAASARGDLPAGAALDLAALERLVAAAWLGGAACADHLGPAPLAIDVDTWPELARLAPDGAVATSLEVWPASPPRLSIDPEGGADELVLETGRTRVDVMVEWAGARWRAATAVVELAVHGRLYVEADGALVFDPSRVDAVPTSLSPGLLASPDPSMVPGLVAPLVEALVLDRPVARLPAALTFEGPVAVDGDYLTWSLD